MKVAVAQLNLTVGDIEGNAQRILRSLKASRERGADLVVFPELATVGYPPKDLLLRRDVVARNLAALKHIATACRDLTAVVGYVEPDDTGTGRGLFNSAAVCRDGAIQASYRKMLLPTYDVFDETRYFGPGGEVCVTDVPTSGGTCRVGITICEDLWNDHQFEGRRVYGVDPIAQTVQAGAKFLVNLSASPFRAGVQTTREELFAGQIRRLGVPLVYAGLVGGNDDLIFDGAGLVLAGDGMLVARAKSFQEDLLVADPDAPRDARVEPHPTRIDGIREGLVLGVRDYLRKCGFTDVVLGISGGIDSALTAAIAVEALGARRVHGVAMPSRFSSDHSVDDARRLAENLGFRFSLIEIEPVHCAMESAVGPVFAELGSPGPGVAEENIQARVRGTILMAMSNKMGSLLLTTGNKSELAVGYCTLYGDMCGGLAVLSDVPKTVVYELARRMNERAGAELIPQRTIDKPPSAELRADQRDQDTLPAYPILDGILERYIEQDQPVEEIVAAGFDGQTVARVAGMVDRSEHKRKQAAVGLKVTSRAFGTGRRMPIAARYASAHPDA